MMTCQDVEALWDDLRDGTLEPARYDAVTAHLGRCPSCAARWRAESVWLSALTDDSSASRPDARLFAAAVLERWEPARGSETAAPPPLRRQPWQRFGVPVLTGLAAAATLGLAAWVGLLVQRTGTARPAPLGRSLAQAQQLFVQQPLTLLDGMDHLTDLLTMGRVSGPLDDVLRPQDALPIPDPAHWFAPAKPPAEDAVHAG